MKSSANCSLLLILLFTFQIQNLYSQPTTWAQPGAHWIYNCGDGSSFGSTGITEVIRIGDTISNGITCDILSIHNMYMENWPTGQWQDYYEPNRYTYQSNDTVYMSSGNLFYPLFVENAQAGSYWITGPDVTSFCGGDTIFIDSSEVITINGILLNKMYPEEFSWGDPDMPSVYFHYPFIERIGSLLYYAPLPTCIICPSWGPLICYSDSSGLFYSPDSAIICPSGINELPNSSGSSITIYPTLATTEINIEWKNAAYKRDTPVEILNSEGQIIATFKLVNQKEKYNVGQLATGVYFLRISGSPSGRHSVFYKL